MYYKVLNEMLFHLLFYDIHLNVIIIKLYKMLFNALSVSKRKITVSVKTVQKKALLLAK